MGLSESLARATMCPLGTKTLRRQEFGARPTKSGYELHSALREYASHFLEERRKIPGIPGGVRQLRPTYRTTCSTLWS